MYLLLPVLLLLLLAQLRLSPIVYTLCAVPPTLFCLL